MSGGCRRAPAPGWRACSVRTTGRWSAISRSTEQHRVGLEARVDHAGLRAGRARADRGRRRPQERGLSDVVVAAVQPGDGDLRARRLFSVDISNPAAPKQLAFRPALTGNYHGEGAHVITFPDGRDILAVNNEFCTPRTRSPRPAAASPSTTSATRRTRRSSSTPPATTATVGELVCCDPDAEGADDPIAHEYHSVFMWVDDGQVYLIGVDNWEQALTDVDIFDITNPSAPVAVARVRPRRRLRPIVDGQRTGSGTTSFLHDMVVKEIDGVQTLLASYWDGGYVLHRTSRIPANATYIGDTRFADTGSADRPADSPRATPTRRSSRTTTSSSSPPTRTSTRSASTAWSTRAPRTSSSSAPPGSPSMSRAPPIVGPQVTAERSLTWDTRYVGDRLQRRQRSPGDRRVRIALVNIVQLPVPAQDGERVEARGYRGIVMFSASNAEVGRTTRTSPATTCYYLGRLRRLPR